MTDGTGAGSDSNALLVVLRGAGKVVAPTAALTAILYYFGWARTEAAAERAGVDQALFGFSTSDYVLRSVGPLYRPIGIGILIALSFYVLLGAVEYALGAVKDRDSRVANGLGTVAVVLVVVALGLLGTGAVGLEDVRQQSPAHLSAFLVLGAAATLWLALVVATAADSELGRAIDRRRTAVVGIIAALVVVGVFAVVLRLAFEDGAGSINSFIEDLPDEPLAVVTSDVPLDIDLVGVDTVLLQGDAELGTSTRFQYSGLHLLLEANDRLFLVTTGFGTDTASSAVAVIPDSDRLRVDFVADRR